MNHTALFGENIGLRKLSRKVIQRKSGRAEGQLQIVLIKQVISASLHLMHYGNAYVICQLYFRHFYTIVGAV
jgi:hypothetical protein